MISRRNVSKRRSAHELDSLIRCTLRESVAGTTPPARVWDRIRASAEYPAASRLAWPREVLDLVLQVGAVCLSRVDVPVLGLDGPPARRSARHEEAVILGCDLGWVRVWDHHRLVRRLVC